MKSSENSFSQYIWQINRRSFYGCGDESERDQAEVSGVGASRLTWTEVLYKLVRWINIRSKQWYPNFPRRTGIRVVKTSYISIRMAVTPQWGRNFSSRNAPLWSLHNDKARKTVLTMYKIIRNKNNPYISGLEPQEKPLGSRGSNTM